MKLPVIACNSGGPLETIDDKVTGYLCESDPKAFAMAMKEFVINPTLKSTFGNAGHERVEKIFSFHSFTKKLDETVTELATRSASECDCTRKCLIFMPLFILFISCIIAFFMH